VGVVPGDVAALPRDAVALLRDAVALLPKAVALLPEAVALLPDTVALPYDAVALLREAVRLIRAWGGVQTSSIGLARESVDAGETTGGLCKLLQSEISQGSYLGWNTRPSEAVAKLSNMFPFISSAHLPTSLAGIATATPVELRVQIASPNGCTS